MIQPTNEQIEFVKTCLDTGFEILEKNSNIDPEHVEGLSLAHWLSLVNGMVQSTIATIPIPEGPYGIDPNFREFQLMRHALSFGVGMAVQLELVTSYNPTIDEGKEV